MSDSGTDSGARRAAARPERASQAQVNLVLAVLLTVVVITGVGSWAVELGTARWWTVVHGVAGLGLLALTPAKFQRSVRPGMRRRRPTRWLSLGFGALVLSTVALGLLHATGLWFGVGYWSALWTHFLLAFVAVPLLVWHVAARPLRLRPVDRDRRLVLRAGTAVAIGGAAYLVQEGLVRAAGTAGSDRATTGSHEVGSGDPDAMPVTSWIDDRTPPEERRTTLKVGGRVVDSDELWALARTVTADLDCTGGWWSRQDWDAVDLATVLGPVATRSVRVVSATGYQRLVPASQLDRFHLAVGYGGRPLLAGHGAPVRLIAPGRRGPWWVKWVVEVTPDDRPAWLQPLFPLT